MPRLMAISRIPAAAITIAVRYLVWLFLPAHVTARILPELLYAPVNNRIPITKRAVSAKRYIFSSLLSWSLTYQGNKTLVGIILARSGHFNKMECRY